MTSIGTVICCVVGKGYFLWAMCSLNKTVRLCPLHFLLQGQTCLFSMYLLTSYFFIPICYDENGIFFFFFLASSRGVIGLHRTGQLQPLLQHQWLGHRLGLMWCWMVCLGNEQRLFCLFWGCTQVLHFGDFPSGSGSKESAFQCRRLKRHEFHPLFGKIPWRKAWEPTPVFLPRKSYGQRSWWATVHRMGKSWTQLKQLSTHIETAFWTLVDYEDTTFALRDSCPQ